MKNFVNRVFYKLFKEIKQRNILKKQTNIFLIGGPEHGNLGDHLIALASKEFLDNKNLDYIELPYSIFNKVKDKIVDNENNLMLLQGGGNFGNQYIGDDNVRLEVVENFPKSRIIIMPQTMYYTQTKEGEDRLEKTIEIFSKHKNLTICAREAVSYEKMKQSFRNNEVILVPDIVLSKDISRKKLKEKKQILFLIRQDLEKISIDKELQEIENWAKQNDYVIKHNDTVKDYNVNIINRNKEINKLFKEIQKSDLIVTDRLHGMISSYINNVPAIVFSNYNHKIISSYDWVKDGKVILYNDGLDISKFITDSKVKDNEPLKYKFNILDEKINIS